MEPQAPPCPECGGTFTIDTTAEKEIAIAPGYFVRGSTRLETRRVKCIVAFCNACEFAIEIVE